MFCSIVPLAPTRHLAGAPDLRTENYHRVASRNSMDFGENKKALRDNELTNRIERKNDRSADQQASVCLEILHSFTCALACFCFALFFPKKQRRRRRETSDFCQSSLGVQNAVGKGDETDNKIGDSVEEIQR